MIFVPPAPYFIISRRLIEACQSQVSCSLNMVGRLARSLGKHHCGSNSPPDEVAEI